MTLTAYGPSYTIFTFGDLKKALRTRGIDGPRGDRKQMIRALREADRKATFRFLDLPPELRNFVYAQLLTVAQEAHAACKQVHDEADGLLNDISEADIRVNVYERKSRFPSGYVRTRYGLDIYYNGDRIFCVGRHGSPDELEWPQLLRKVRKFTLRVNLQSSRDKPHDNNMLREAPISHALHSLYTYLSKSSNSPALNVAIFADVRARSFLLQEVLYPVCALAGLIGNSTFNFIKISEDVATELQEATAEYRRLFHLEDEIRLAIKIHSVIYGKLPEGLRTYGQIVAPRHGGLFFDYADSEYVEWCLRVIYNEVKRLLMANIDRYSDGLADAMARLKKMRVERKMRDVKHDLR